MKYAVFDASYYPASQLGVAAQMIRADLGDDYCQFADAALVSSVHPQQSDVIERIAKKYSRVYVGGPGALSPGNYEAATGVVLGDYRGFLEALRLDRLDALQNIYYPSSPKVVSIDQSFPYEKSGLYAGEDGRMQVFCSRGCKHRCAFCQTGWAGEFSENPEPKK